MFVLILSIVAIYFLIRFLGRQKFETKGEAGERSVAKILSTLPSGYMVLNDVIVPTKRGTSQIDHVVVSRYGIFVIETKNYSGTIYGSESANEWKETFRTTECNFYNPVKQNQGHVWALASCLRIPQDAFVPIVVFSDEADLKVKSKTAVVYMSELLPEILSYDKQIFGMEQAVYIYQTLKEKDLTGTKEGDAHVKFVRESVRKKEEALRRGRCPKCGSKLVVRQSRYGTFLGCSSYPDCGYTNSGERDA